MQDITDFPVEAFVFYARPNLALGAGFGNAIAMRGGPSIKAELERIGSLPLLEAVVTAAGNLKAKHIVHAVGPAFQEENIETKLKTTILNALRCAEEKGIKQLAFPLMGAGFFGVPLTTSAEIMIGALKEYLASGSHLAEIILCANDGREYRAIAGQMASFG
jgi:O-acetyl-ADP-ribose deacetylase (regulator of RNase III)